MSIDFNSVSTAGLPRSAPEEQGISSRGVNEFVQALDQKVDQIHSVMVVRHGHVVVERWWKPESPKKPHVMWSLSKSFTSTAIGIAVDEGRLNVNDLVVDFFPEDISANPSEYLKAMRVHDLLTMTAGHENECRLGPDENWVRNFLAHPVLFQPGTHFVYNSPATYMCSAILQKLTGETLLEYLRPRLFEPLGIQNPHWWSSPQGINVGGWGLEIRTEDIARFGQLYLQKGEWNGRQLVSRAWVEQASAKQVSNGDKPDSDWSQGYGFQFWRCRHNAYRGDGKDGQFCIVIPDLDTVVAMTALTVDLQVQLSLVWEYLLPAIQ